MSLSIRGRLTLWYSSIVVAVLVTAGVTGGLAQSELAIERLDADLARSLATLEGVMRTEIGEGLTLDASAEEASLEVVVPDRALMLRRPDGSLLRLWGLRLFDAAPVIDQAVSIATVPSSAGELRVLNQAVDYRGHRYIATVMAPLAPLRAEHREMISALAVGILLAVLVAIGGGWLIGRQTLRPLTRMADDARRLNTKNPAERLVVPAVDDELGRLATAFNGVLDRLASALNLQRQFMADASHELRTPVSVVRAASEVTLSAAARSADEYREALTITGEQARRLSRLVDAMFLLSRAEANGVPLTKEFLNLDDLLAECARALRVLADGRSVTVSASGDQEIGMHGDDALLRQMIGNLLDNAIRHAQTGGRVDAELRRSGDVVMLRVTDDGPGVAETDRDRIFDRFVRAATSGGAGLGLPIARWVAEAHGGTLELEQSEPGRTTFVARLPGHAAGVTDRVPPSPLPDVHTPDTAPAR